MIHNKASQFASKLAGLVSLAIAGRRYVLNGINLKYLYLSLLFFTFVSSAHAEVMDKEVTLITIILFGLIGSAVVVLCGRYKPWFLLLTFPALALFFGGLILEVNDESIRPAILVEAGVIYINSTYILSVIAFLSPFIGLLWRFNSVSKKVEPNGNSKRSLWQILNDWYNGNSIMEDPVIASGVVMIPAPYVEYHWTAKCVRSLVSFYLKHWQWFWGTVIAITGLYAAFFKN